jgi:hypothetical protein
MVLLQTVFAKEGKCYVKNRTQAVEYTRTATPLSTAVPNQPIKNLPSGFRGVNKGIGSWFRANHGHDATNGNSWCGYPYTDATNGFAPDLSVMTKGTNAVYPNPMWEPSAREYCGLEAKVTNPATGKTLIMYITDGFDPKWVKTPGSIDIMIDKFQELTGGGPLDKNRVIQGVTWELTGNRNPKYAFKGPGDRY